MTLTAHFIDDDWKLHKRILNFCIVQNHKGETIGKVIENCLIEWGIERVFTITVDNASSNDVAVNFLKEKLNYWKGNVLDGEFLHVRCAAHIVNLIVTFGLKEIHDSIAGIRNAIRYVRSSPSRLNKFKECVEKEKIEYKETVVLDVSTRWNSTYLMLNSALKYQKGFDRMIDADGHYLGYFEEDEVGRKRAGPPLIKDWDSARVFVKFLATFYEVTLKFSASLTVTSNICFHELSLMYNALVEWSNSQNHLMADMAKKMLIKFDKYWGSLGNVNKLLLIAIVLDPRYKLEYVSYLFEDAYESGMVESLTRDVKDTLVNLYNFYKEIDSMNGSSKVSNSNDGQSMQAQQSGMMMDSLDDGSIDDRRRLKESQFKKRKWKKMNWK
nr:zinc finger BED domain-containing protein RICESLEEPER 2-like [Ziziphus jujuba var. spinosa]